jgi:hypothetical protein
MTPLAWMGIAYSCFGWCVSDLVRGIQERLASHKEHRP